MLVAEVGRHDPAVHEEGHTTLVTVFGHPSTGDFRSRKAKQDSMHKEINAED